MKMSGKNLTWILATILAAGSTGVGLGEQSQPDSETGDEKAAET